MLIAASVMKSVSGWPGTSMTKTWLMRRSVRRPVAEAVDLAASARRCAGCPSSGARPCPRGSARPPAAAAAWLCGRVDDLAAGEVEAVLGRHGADLRLRADQDRHDQPGLGGLDGAAQRGLVAGMGDDRHRRRAVAGGGDQAVVLRAGRGRVGMALLVRSGRLAAGRAAAASVTSSGPRPKSAATRCSRAAGGVAGSAARLEHPAERGEGGAALLDRLGQQRRGSPRAPPPRRSAASSTARAPAP